MALCTLFCYWVTLKNILLRVIRRMLWISQAAFAVALLRTQRVFVVILQVATETVFLWVISLLLIGTGYGRRTGRTWRDRGRFWVRAVHRNGQVFLETGVDGRRVDWNDVDAHGGSLVLGEHADGPAVAGEHGRFVWQRWQLGGLVGNGGPSGVERKAGVREAGLVEGGGGVVVGVWLVLFACDTVVWNV